MKNHILYLITISALLLTGCSSIKTPLSTGAPYGNATVDKNISKRNISNQKIIEHNTNFWKEQYTQEQKHYWENKDVKEKNYKKNATYGLALSGGGTRSASFSIGVLGALKKNKILHELDYISSVSGGSYASYWLYSNYYYLYGKHNYQKDCGGPYKVDDIFETIDYDSEMKYSTKDYERYPLIPFKDSNETRAIFQRHLETNSKLMSRTPNPNFLDSSYNVLQNIISWPVGEAYNLLANVVWDCRVNSNPLRKFYQNGIERTYGIIPCKKTNEMYNGQKYFTWNPVNSDRKLKFSDIRTLIEEDIHIPIPIINMTAGYATGSGAFFGIGGRETTISQTVFEATPFQVGSQAYGFKPTNETQLNEFPLTTSISGAAVSGQAREAGFWGSFALRAFNAELGYDIKNENQDSTWYKDTLSNLPVLYLLSPQNQDISNRHIHLSDGGGSENLGVYSLVKRGVENIIVVDAELDSISEFDGLERLKEGLRTELNMYLDLNTSEFDVYDNNITFIRGKIKYIPGLSNNKSEINLFYIKLSIDQKRISLTCKKNCYPMSVRKFYQRELNKEEKMEDIKKLVT